MVLNPNYLNKKNDGEEFRTYSRFLDVPDTIFAVNFFIGYFGTTASSIDLMRKQKIIDLKEKNLWNGYAYPFAQKGEINGGDFGVNVYFVGNPKQGSGRRKQPDYIKFLDLTSSHINFGGFRCVDFIVTLTDKHRSIQFIQEKQTPYDEYILGFIRLDSGVLSNKPLQQYLGIDRLEPNFINSHILNSKIIVPTQPFGSKFRGGKLLTLISQSNELRDFFNKMYQSNVVLFYTMSLFGSTKSSSQYDQLDRFIKFIGVTESKHPIRMKNPQKEQLLEWLDRRGISRSLFVKNSSSQEDKTFKNLIHFLEYSLLQNRHDKTVSKLRKLFSTTIDDLMNRTEKKRVYVGTYGCENWDDNLYNSVPVVDHKNNLDCLFDYWKSKVFKKKDWGMRKYKHYLDQPVPLEYELLNDQLRDSNFNYVR